MSNLNKNEFYISKQFRLADLVQLDLHLLSLLERYGIHPGFGNKSVEEVCDEKKLNLDFFVMLLNTYHNSSYVPDNSFLCFEVESIIDYLQRSHRHYSKVIIPGVQSLINDLLLNQHPDIFLLIDNFFRQYKSEVLTHFEYEDYQVFPSIMKLGRAIQEKTAWIENEAIRSFKKKHEPIENKINDLKSILLKYLPANDQVFLRNMVLQNIFQLENDLQKHIRIEERILIPIVEQMELKLENKVKVTKDLIQ